MNSPYECHDIQVNDLVRATGDCERSLDWRSECRLSIDEPHLLAWIFPPATAAAYCQACSFYDDTSLPALHTSLTAEDDDFQTLPWEDACEDVFSSSQVTCDYGFGNSHEGNCESLAGYDGAMPEQPEAAWSSTGSYTCPKGSSRLFVSRGLQYGSANGGPALDTDMVGEMYPDRTMPRSNPFPYAYNVLPMARPQAPRFECDLYTSSWIRGEGTEREAWCGYCSKWLRLKDSTYWVCQTLPVPIYAS